MINSTADQQTRTEPGSDRCPKRVVMIDDQATYTEGLAMAFDMQSDLEVVARATSSDQGVDIALQIQPDLVLCDYRIPGQANGVECAARLRASGYNGEIVILTGFAAPHIHTEAEQLANVQVLSKDLSVIDLVETLTQPQPAPHSPTTEHFAPTPTPTQPVTRPKRFRLLFGAATTLAAMTLAITLASIFQPTSAPPELGLKQPFVIIDGTEPTTVSITIGDSPTNTFTPTHLPVTIAIGTTTDTIEVVIEGSTGSRRNSCAVGTNHRIQITDTDTPAGTICAGTLH